MHLLLDDPRAVSKMRNIYRSYLEVVAKNRMCALMEGLDYRASPDWGERLGCSTRGLAEANHHALAFLREIADEYTADIPEILIQGIIGPRVDAYERNETITENEAEDCHSVQLETLKEADVDLAFAMTFNNIRESIGVARAAPLVRSDMCFFNNPMRRFSNEH